MERFDFEELMGSGERRETRKDKQAGDRGCSNRSSEPGASISPRGNDRIGEQTEFHRAKGCVEPPIFGNQHEC